MHELAITQFFNHTLAGVANVVLSAVGLHAKDPANPWVDWMVCETLVVLVVVLLFSYLRARLSVDRPGKLQHVMELVYEFVRSSTDEVVGHGSERFVPFFGTMFLFILFMNLSAVIPGFEAPTQEVVVPLGLAVLTFVYYHAVGIKANGFGYIKQFLGPMLIIAPILFVIEVISHFARPMSLTVRLWANMFAGEQVYLTFLSLTKLIIPVIFIGLHTFVGILQAYIFMLLAMVYVGGAVSHEH